MFIHKILDEQPPFRRKQAAQGGRKDTNDTGTRFRTLKLSGFNLTIGQAAVIFPFMVQLPRYLSKQISLGEVMQTGNAFGQVQEALSFFRESYETFAGYRAVLERLSGFLDSIQEANILPSLIVESLGTHVMVSKLTVRRPDATTLVSDLTLDISTHQPLLVRGHSGVGKTTLLRAIAGLWPFAEGEITRPTGADSLFLSQKAYLPIGSLREAIYYPMAAEQNEHANETLIHCQLGHLAGRLDEYADWAQRLSPGEQQRLAFGRILLNKPAAVFLDEATSAMDEGLEEAMYRLLREQLPDTVVVSVGHRSTLKLFHRFELILFGDGKWELKDL